MAACTSSDESVPLSLWLLGTLVTMETRILLELPTKAHGEVSLPLFLSRTLYS